MTWSAIYRKDDGELCSVGSVVAKSLPEELAVKALIDRPDLSKVVWDKVKLDFVPVSPAPPDPVMEAVAGFADLDVSALTQAQLLALIVKALKFLVKREMSRG